MLGIFISISSPSWFSAWIGLELNLLSFISLILTKMSSYLSEVALKYFLIQAMASTMIIFSSLFMMNFKIFFMPYNLFSSSKTSSSIFSFFISTSNSSFNLISSYYFNNYSKLAPMFILSILITNSTLIMILMMSSILSAMIGALSGFNMMKLCKVMAFSSISHMSWMLISISINDMMWMIYFMFYSIISLFLL